MDHWKWLGNWFLGAQGMLWFVGLLALMFFGALKFMDFQDRRAAHGPEPYEDDSALADLMHEDLHRFTEDMAGTPHSITPTGTASPDVFLSAELMSPVPDEDLVILWDDRDGAPPTLRVRPNPGLKGILDITLADEIVAHIPSAAGVGAKDIVLVPQSQAHLLGDLV